MVGTFSRRLFYRIGKTVHRTFFPATVNSRIIIAKKIDHSIEWSIIMAPQVGLEPTTLRLTAECSTGWAIEEYLWRHCLIFPGRFQPSIVSTAELNYCVRDGNRWNLCAKNTAYISDAFASIFSKLQWWPVADSNCRCRRERPES